MAGAPQSESMKMPNVSECYFATWVKSLCESATSLKVFPEPHTVHHGYWNPSAQSFILDPRKIDLYADDFFVMSQWFAGGATKDNGPLEV